jgi:hypothetical protein
MKARRRNHVTVVFLDLLHSRLDSQMDSTGPVPIEKLPDDLLVKIFEAFVEPSSSTMLWWERRTEITYQSRQVAELRTVCKHWNVSYCIMQMLVS